MPRNQELSLAEIRDLLEAELVGDENFVVTGLADLRSAGPDQISFLSSKKYLADLGETQAGAVLLTPEYADSCSVNRIVVADPYLSFAVLSAMFATRDKRNDGIHPSAVVHESAQVGENVAISANCFVGADAVIGDDVELYPGVVVCERAKVGKGSILYPNVVLYHEVELGENVSIHANSTIGCDGFGYAPNNGAWKKIHQIGTVIIGNRVEIGASCSIDRGAIKDTIIYDDVIIDNQVHIAHNVTIGKGSAIAGCTGFAGSTKVGEHCQFGGQVAVAGHIDIADHSIFLGASAVTKGTKDGGVYASTGVMQAAADWRKTSVRIKQLDSLFERVKKLEKDKS